MTNPTKSIQVSKTNYVVLCLVEFIHVSVLILCLNVQTLVDQFGCSVKAGVGKVKKGVNVCLFCMFIESGHWYCSVIVILGIYDPRSFRSRSIKVTT